MPATGAFARSKAATLDFRPMMFMEEYIEGLYAEGKNPDYIRQVRSGLHHLAEYLRTENVLSPEEITRLHIVRYQANCNSRVDQGEWTKSYSIQMLKKARAWINWMDQLGYITANPWQSIRVGTVKKQPKPLEDEDVETLFRAHRRNAFSMDSFIFHRREVILTLLYSWGLRIHELEALNVAGMDMRLDYVVARNKGGGTKRLPYTDEIKRVVLRYLNQRGRHADRAEDALLITTNGSRLSKEQVRDIVTSLGKECGVAINPHRLRDTCGTHLLDSDVPAERVQKILGHSQLSQTLAYSRVNDKKVYESLTLAMDPRLSSLLFRSTSDLETAE